MVWDILISMAIRHPEEFWERSEQKSFRIALAASLWTGEMGDPESHFFASYEMISGGRSFYGYLHLKCQSRIKWENVLA